VEGGDSAAWTGEYPGAQHQEGSSAGWSGRGSEPPAEAMRPSQVEEQAQAVAGLWFSDHAEHKGTGPAPRRRGLPNPPLPSWAAPTRGHGGVDAGAMTSADVLSRDALEDLIVRLLEWALRVLRAAEQGSASAPSPSIHRWAAWGRAPGGMGKPFETQEAQFADSWSRRTSEETTAGAQFSTYGTQESWAGWLPAEQCWTAPRQDQKPWPPAAPGLELTPTAAQSTSQRDVASTGSASPVKDLAQPRRKLTLMLRHIPCRVRDADVRDLLRRQGLDGKFHSIQVPMDAETDGNLGYAFVVFKTQAALDTGLRVLAGQRFPGCTSDKLTSTEVAMGRRPKWALRGAAGGR